MSAWARRLLGVTTVTRASWPCSRCANRSVFVSKIGLLLAVVVVRFREQGGVFLHLFHAPLSLEKIQLAIAHHERRGIGLYAPPVREPGRAKRRELRHVLLGVRGGHRGLLVSGDSV